MASFTSDKSGIYLNTNGSEEVYNKVYLLCVSLVHPNSCKHEASLAIWLFNLNRRVDGLQVQVESWIKVAHLQEFKTFHLSVRLASHPDLLPLQRGTFLSSSIGDTLCHPLVWARPPHHQRLIFPTTKVDSDWVEAE